MNFSGKYEERPAGLIDQHRADIAAGHREGAVREIDEVHQPERHGKTAGENEQQHAVGDTVEQIGENGGHRERTYHIVASASPLRGPRRAKLALEVAR